MILNYFKTSWLLRWASEKPKERRIKKKKKGIGLGEKSENLTKTLSNCFLDEPDKKNSFI